MRFAVTVTNQNPKEREKRRIFLSLNGGTPNTSKVLLSTNGGFSHCKGLTTEYCTIYQQKKNPGNSPSTKTREKIQLMADLFRAGKNKSDN